MHTSSLHLATERIGRTAADRAAREAVGTLLAVCQEPPAGATPEAIAWCVMRAYVTPYTADDEAAAIVRAVMTELGRMDDAAVRR